MLFLGKFGRHPTRSWVLGGPAPLLQKKQIRGSIVVSISARHAEDPGSIPGRGDLVQSRQATVVLRIHTILKQIAFQDNIAMRAECRLCFRH